MAILKIVNLFYTVISINFFFNLIIYIHLLELTKYHD